MLLTFLTGTVEQYATQATPTNNIIGIGGIIATLIAAALTCLVTWKLTMKGMKQKKLSYNIQLFPILANHVDNKTELNFADLEIKYKDKPLQNPCLLTLEIANVGNEAIEKPPIRICSESGVQIIPGYFEDVPNGYSELWKIRKKHQTACEIELTHINPKQVVKVRFFLDDMPNGKIKFECPMPNVQIQEVAYTDANKAALKATSYSRANLALIAMTVLLFLTIEQWSNYIADLVWETNISLPVGGAVAFIMATLLLAIIFNAYGIPKVDIIMKAHKKQSHWAILGMIVVSTALLFMIIFDVLIVGVIAQMSTAMLAVVLLAYSIHLGFIIGND